jgi:hypothetical protein
MLNLFPLKKVTTAQGIYQQPFSCITKERASEFPIGGIWFIYPGLRDDRIDGIGKQILTISLFIQGLTVKPVLLLRKRNPSGFQKYL